MTEKRFSQADLEQLPSRYRAHLCNTLPGFKSLNLIGTQNAEGVNNLGIFTQVFHVGSNPSLIGILFRPHTVRRDTLENILEHKHFTLNHVHESFYQKAHQTAAKYEANESEFEGVGLTPEFTPDIKAPYVKESQVKIGLELADRVDISINNTVLIIGRTLEVRVPEEHIKEDGYLDLAAIGSITCTDVDAYHSVNKLARMAYAKPDTDPTELPENLF